MKNKDLTWMIWIPRILGILIACFLFLFSFDSFEGDASIWVKLGGFLIHNIPSVLLLLIIILSWHKPFWTGIVFLCLGILFTGFFRTYQRFDTFMLISFPVFISGALFIWASLKKKRESLPGSSHDSL
ncbi:MAG: hypothetical protein AB9842_13665 [Bacteroidales bacterium]